MELCSNGHAEVCYDGRLCPLCITIDDYTVLCKDLDKLQEEKMNYKDILIITQITRRCKNETNFT